MSEEKEFNRAEAINQLMIDMVKLSGMERISIAAEILGNTMDAFDAEGWKDHARTKGIVELAQVMDKVQILTENIDRSKKELQKFYDWMRMSIVPDKMDEAGVESMQVTGVGRLYLTASLNASIKAGAKESAYQYLQDHGHGDIIGTTVNASSLKALAKDKIRNNDPLPSDLFNVSPVTRATIQRK